MQDHIGKLTSALLIGTLVSTTALPAMAQQKPRDLMEHIKDDPPQDYVLTRCVGFFKALAMTNADADQRLKNRAEATMRWMFEQILAMRGQSAEGNLDEVGLEIAEDIDTHARFYLDRMTTNISETGQTSDELMVVDQNVCLYVASQRPEGQ